MIKQKRHPIAVIGSGLGGLGAACTLAARGHQVVVFEKNAWTGGKAAELSGDGFRFDMGPTILTIPSVLRRIFSEAGEDMNNHLKLVKLDPQWRCMFEGGGVLDLVENREHMRRNLDSFAPGSSAGYERFMDLSEKLRSISDRYFFWRSIGGIKDMFDLSNTFQVSTLKDVMAMRMGRSVARTVRDFIPDQRAAQMVDHFTQYVGSSPDASPAVLCGIASMQTEEGVWYPIGGTRAVPVALRALAERLGVEFRTGTFIRRVEHQNGTATAVISEDGTRTPVSAVVSNCDSVRTYRELIGGAEMESFERKQKHEPACSGVVLYLGLRKKYDHILHHNFVFSRDPHEEFAAIYDRGEPAPDPTCYVCAPAGTEPAVAPPGGEALYVLVHTPYLRSHHDWKTMLPAYRRTILEKLKTTGGMKDIEDRIVFERTLTPEDIHTRYHVLNGAIYGLASHGKFLGAFKPGNRRSDIRGLYLCGGAAHPGPGMPMVMMSGWIAADSLDKDLRNGVVDGGYENVPRSRNAESQIHA